MQTHWGLPLTPPLLFFAVTNQSLCLDLLEHLQVSSPSSSSCFYQLSSAFRFPSDPTQLPGQQPELHHAASFPVTQGFAALPPTSSLPVLPPCPHVTAFPPALCAASTEEVLIKFQLFFHAASESLLSLVRLPEQPPCAGSHRQVTSGFGRTDTGVTRGCCCSGRRRGRRWDTDSPQTRWHKSVLDKLSRPCLSVLNVADDPQTGWKHLETSPGETGLS